MNVLDSIADRNLIGAWPALRDLSTWMPWLTFLSAVYGLPLPDGGLELFKRATGRSVYAPPPGGWPEVVAIVGRQAGKTRAGSIIVAHEACVAPASRDGSTYALLLAQDSRAAVRASFSYVKTILDASPMLRAAVERETNDTIDLENGIRIACYPCRPASVRGVRARVVVLDELAFFRSSEGYSVDTEMLRAVRPALATTGGKLVIISSPYGQSGALWDLRRKHFGRDDAPILVWQADAPTMNPTLPANYLERMLEEDPEAYRSEVLGEFRAGLATLLDPERIAACVATDRLELPPVGGVQYQAFVDPSGGRADTFTLAIGHQEGSREDARAVVDVVRGWRPPLNPAGVVSEVAALLRTYRVSRVVGDRYAGEWPREAFRSHGISYDIADHPKSDLYLELVAHVNGARLELPDHADLLRELRTLERRRGTSGRDRVDHPQGRHDDFANAVAGLGSILLRRRGVTFEDAIRFNQMGSEAAERGWKRIE